MLTFHGFSEIAILILYSLAWLQFHPHPEQLRPNSTVTEASNALWLSEGSIAIQLPENWLKKDSCGNQLLTVEVTPRPVDELGPLEDPRGYRLAAATLGRRVADARLSLNVLIELCVFITKDNEELVFGKDKDRLRNALYESVAEVYREKSESWKSGVIENLRIRRNDRVACASFDTVLGSGNCMPMQRRIEMWFVRGNGPMLTLVFTYADLTGLKNKYQARPDIDFVIRDIALQYDANLEMNEE